MEETEIEGFELDEISDFEKDDNKNYFNNIDDNYKILISGGIAGSVAKTFTAPLSRLTILFQVHSLVTTKVNRPAYALSIKNAIKKLIQKEGFLALYKSNGISVLHRAPYSAVNFFLYERFKSLVGEDSESLINRFISGALAASISCISFYPLDLMRTIRATSIHNISIIDSFKNIIKNENVFGLYRGLNVTLLVQVPSLAISLTSYNLIKDYFINNNYFCSDKKRLLGDTIYLNVPGSLFAAAFSGFLSSLATYPIDVIRRRIQIQTLHGKSLSPMGHVVYIMKNQGFFRGMYSGLSLELLKILPTVCCMFACYEFLKKSFNVGNN